MGRGVRRRPAVRGVAAGAGAWPAPHGRGARRRPGPGIGHRRRLRSVTGGERVPPRARAGRRAACSGCCVGPSATGRPGRCARTAPCAPHDHRSRDHRFRDPPRWPGRSAAVPSPAPDRRGRRARRRGRAGHGPRGLGPRGGRVVEPLRRRTPHHRAHRGQHPVQRGRQRGPRRAPCRELLRAARRCGYRHGQRCHAQRARSSPTSRTARTSPPTGSSPPTATR